MYRLEAPGVWEEVDNFRISAFFAPGFWDWGFGFREFRQEATKSGIRTV